MLRNEEEEELDADDDDDTKSSHWNDKLDPMKRRFAWPEKQLSLSLSLTGPPLIQASSFPRTLVIN